MSFPALADKAEVEYFNGLATSIVLPAEAFDRLRVRARKLVKTSPEFNRLPGGVGARPAP
jgi:hypothetical protein